MRFVFDVTISYDFSGKDKKKPVLNTTVFFFLIGP